MANDAIGDMITVLVEMLVIFTSAVPGLLYVYCTTVEVISEYPKSRGIDDGSVGCINVPT